MLTPSLRLSLGPVVVDSGAPSSADPLVRLRVDADLADPAATLDVWLGELGGSIGVGDAARLELGYGDDRAVVFTGSVDRVEPDLEGLHVQALDDAAKLLRLRIGQVYEQQTAGQIVTDLARQAGVRTGSVQDGLGLPFYVVDDVRSAWQHCRDLAERAGFDLYLTPDAALTFVPPPTAGADHRFTYARDVLTFEVADLPQDVGRVEVWGESPASSEGVEAASWLVADFSASLGTAGSGTTLRISDPAIRTKDDAQASAKGRLAALSRQAVSGSAAVLGNPQVVVGAMVTVVDVPDPRLDRILQVRRVTHHLDKRGGFVTRLQLWGSTGGRP